LLKEAEHGARCIVSWRGLGLLCVLVLLLLHLHAGEDNSKELSEFLLDDGKDAGVESGEVGVDFSFVLGKVGCKEMAENKGGSLKVHAA
jgi:hypothetical protein